MLKYYPVPCFGFIAPVQATIQPWRLTDSLQHYNSIHDAEYVD
jgi:hypothetical protein